MMKLNVIWLMLVCSFSCSFGQEDAWLSEFERANKAYTESDFDGAISFYESILDQEVISEELFTNVGTAYLKKGEIGKAILNLEKALLINGSNKNAKLNLALAKENIDNPISLIPDFVLVTFWNSLTSLLSVRGWVIAHLVFLAVAILFLSTQWLSFDFGLLDGLKMWRGTYHLTLLVFLLSLFALFMSLERKDQMKGTNYGIVMNSGTVLTDGPDDRSNEVAIISEGSRVLALDRIDNWYKVQMDDKDEGWMISSNLEFIRL